ncbi:MAG: cupin domain-containing protein [Solirubrobacteraceae bacterium]
MRRVVIGAGNGNASGVLFDGAATELVRHSVYPVVSVAELWRATSGAAVDGSDRALERAGERPGPGESRFYAVRIDPGSEIPLHATPTVDYHCVVAGEVTCLLEGEEVTVRAGDVLVLQGEPHGWVNRGDEPFISMAVMVNTESE